MSANSPLLTALTQQYNFVQSARQRALVVLSGDRQWARQLLQDFFQQMAITDALWIAETPADNTETVAAKQVRQYLGREINHLVYDAWDGFDPDALAAISGALVGGGLLILLTPPLPQWPEYADPDYQRLLAHPYSRSDITGRFIQHIIASIRSDQQALVIEQERPIDFTATQPQPSSPIPAMPDHCLTADQSEAVKAIVAQAAGRGRRPLVIRSDRGRGKSSALGIASAELMQQRPCTILITAPRPESVQTVFTHTARLLGTEQTNDRIQHNNAQLVFIAPDELIRQQPAADLLLVDEAAAIPAFMLEQYLTLYNRVVFATTVHGYEGSGRGFDIRFKHSLDTLTPQWRSCFLNQPIRWADNDPLERWLFNTLLLKESVIDITDYKSGQCVCERLDRDQLVNNPAELGQLFSLLVCAHYQTSPADLRQILDGPNIAVWVSRYRGQIVAAAVLSAEGGFDRDLAMAIWQGERRPQGHLMAQSLAAHCGFQQAPELRYQRVMRIAVHPDVQRQHIGQQLIAEITQVARQEGFDFIGSSFAATADVLQFWRAVQSVPVHLGASRDSSSGCYSAMVLSALTSAGEDLLGQARQRFGEYFPRSLLDRYQYLDSELVAALLLDHDKHSIQLDQQAWLEIEAFALGQRQYENCYLSLWKLSLWAASIEDVLASLSANQQRLLVLRILQQQSIDKVVATCNLTGKKALQAALREIILKLFQQRQRLLETT